MRNWIRLAKGLTIDHGRLVSYRSTRSNAHRYQTLGRDVVESLPIGRPSRIQATAKSDLTRCLAIRAGDQIDFCSSGYVRLISDPPSIRRNRGLSVCTRRAD